MINFLEITKSRLRNKILLHFFTNTDDEMYLREMALRLKEDPGNLSKELSRLATNYLEFLGITKNFDEIR